MRTNRPTPSPRGKRPRSTRAGALRTGAAAGSRGERRTADADRQAETEKHHNVERQTRGGPAESAPVDSRPGAGADSGPGAAVDSHPGPAVSLLAVRNAIVSCERCPRLRAYCADVASVKKRAHAHETYWGRPVPGFGDPRARLLVLGLAPAAHGANRTGRVFTGDGSGDFLMRAMHDAGFASVPTSRTADDGLALTGAWIAAAVPVRAARQQALADRDPCVPRAPRCGVGSARRHPRDRRPRAHRLRFSGCPPRPPPHPMERAARVRPRCCVPGGRCAPPRVVSSKPPEHEHRPADGPDARLRVPGGAFPPGRPGRRRSGLTTALTPVDAVRAPYRRPAAETRPEQQESLRCRATDPSCG